jgi:molybdopterin-dependent oxidoreductase alpha subunit
MMGSAMPDPATVMPDPATVMPDPATVMPDPATVMPDHATAPLSTSDEAASIAEDGRIGIHRPKTTAAGLTGVAVALRHALGEMGVRRTARTLSRLNQADGFDCPGCAWPEPHDRSRAEFCENGAKAVAEEATTKRIGAEFFRTHTVAELAEQTDFWLGKRGRITEPMVLRAGSANYEPISWDAAFSLIADELRALPSPDAAAFYTSGRTSNEAAFAYQLFVRRFGTNNLPDCSNMCHESSGVALSETIGIGKGSVTLEDIHAADLIFVVGQNPGTNHPRMLSALEEAKQHGARIIAVNPLPEAGLLAFRNPQSAIGLVKGAALADRHLAIRVNGDLALFQALGRLLIEAEDAAPGTVLDHAFIDAHCDGFEALVDHLRALDWADVLEATGLTRAEIEAVAADVIASKRVIVCWAMGLTQHKNSVATIREVVNFLLLRGNIGRSGAGVCPVRGHSNVQGDRTMGIYEKPTEAFLAALDRSFAITSPRHHGVDVVEAVKGMRDGSVQVLFALGGNFASATPDTEATFAAMRTCRLTVHVSTKLNRAHVVTGRQALILPCLGRTERDRTGGREQIVTVEDSMSVVHTSRGSLPPASPDLLSEVDIVCRLARAVLPADHVPWEAMARDYDVIRSHIESVVPGFQDFNDRVRRPGGFTLPHPPRDERRFTTATGRARFTTNPLEILKVPAGHLLLQTVRSHDQYNTTIYGLDDRYRGVKNGRRVVFAHRDDLKALGFADGDVVDVVGLAADGVARRARKFRLIAYPIAVGTCAAYFPEANVLVPLDSVADRSGTPTSKSVIVRFEKSAD